ncbi:MAG: VWA domain-containing protein [Phycisphaeraceae bacterium]|nr:VWA domain-containing protein [Phycisphaeraceae bacterium]MCB9847229.1 VWA domain-containing protein [Phycisphaeraceae bacterium]
MALASGIGFLDPIWLLLAIVALPLAIIGFRWLHAMSRLRRWSAVLLRTALVVLLTMMLATAVTRRETDRLAVVAVVDVSESVRRLADLGVDAEGARADAIARAQRWVADAIESGQADTENLVGVVVFDGEPTAIATPRHTTSADILGQPFDIAVVEGTNIEEAIRFASAIFPPDAARRIVLISDGVETAGDALAAAVESTDETGAPTPIDIVALNYSTPNEILIESVDSPPNAPEQSTVPVRVVVRSTTAAAGELLLLREGRPIDLSPGRPGVSDHVELHPGANPLTYSVPLPESNVHRFEARFIPDSKDADTIAVNNNAESFTITPGRGDVLIVDGVSDNDPSGPGAILAQTLRGEEIDVTTIAPAAFPDDLLSLQAHDLIILQNIAADEIPQISQKHLGAYVNDFGGGLVMIGGYDSLGAGAWGGTPVEDLLPVKLDPSEELIVPAAAIVFVLDSSGSMASPVRGSRRTQQDIANEGAALAIGTLDERDLVGVIAFDSSWRSVVDLAPLKNPDHVKSRVRSIAPGGGTNMYPALAQAGEWLNKVDADVKHIIVLSDGQSMGEPNVGVSLAQKLAAQDITVSAIAVGDGADSQTMERIALYGQGEFYNVNNPYILPKIFLKEMKIVSRRMVREVDFTPIRRPQGSPLDGAIPSSMPPLHGYVLTQRKPAGGVMTPLLTPEDEPVLAHWNVGLGQVAAWTSDAHDAWAKDWLTWPGYRALWTQIVRTIGRASTNNRAELVTGIEGDTLRIRVDLFDDDGAPLDLASVTGAVIDPNGDSVEIALRPVGPGAYEGEAQAAERGQYVVLISPKLGETSLAPIISAASRADSPEFARLSANPAALERLRQRTGGRTLDINKPKAAGIFDRYGVPPIVADSPIWRELMIAAIAVLLLDIATRRVAWDRLASREVLGEIRAQRAERVRRRTREAEATLSALKQKKRREPTPTAEPAASVLRPEPTPTRPAHADRQTPQADEHEGAGGLLAAKRRARQMYGGDESGHDETGR